MNIKNKRLKMSPNGIITLPVSARKALGMSAGKSSKIKISTDGKSILLAASTDPKDQTFRVSSQGMTSLKGEEQKVLLNSTGRHYWMKLDDKKQEVHLMPF